MTDLSKWRKVSEKVTRVGWRAYAEKIFIDLDGKEQSYITWNKPGYQAAGIIAITSDKKVIIAEQYRLGPEKILAELPGGEVEPGEDPAAAAARELIEETGYDTDEPLEYLGSAPRDAYMNGIWHCYMALNCKQVLTPDTIADEYIVIKLISIDEFIQNAKNGLMTDGAAVLMAYDKLKKIQEGSDD